MEDLIAAARELKVPLSTLRQLALGLGMAGADDERIRAEMIGVSERAMRRVNDLLRLTRLTSGAYEMEPVAVRMVCAEAYDEVRRLAEPCAVTVECRNRVPLVTANRELLSSMVYNLLLNATAVARDEVKMIVRDARGGVEIAIRDRGPVSMAMRPGADGLAMVVATRFAEYLRAEMGAVRHRDGMSFCVWLPRSQQRRLFV